MSRRASAPPDDGEADLPPANSPDEEDAFAPPPDFDDEPPPRPAARVLEAAPPARPLAQEPPKQAIALPVESLASLTARKAPAAPSTGSDDGPTLSPDEVREVWGQAVAMARRDTNSTAALLNLMAEAAPLDCRDGQFRLAFPPEKSKLIAWIKRRDREAVESLLREAAGARLRLSIVEEAISVPVRTLGAPLVGRPSAPPVDPERLSAFDDALALAAREARPLRRPAPPDDLPPSSDMEMVAEDDGPAPDRDDSRDSYEGPYAGDDGDYASPDFDEDYLKRVAESYGPPGQRLEAILAANQTLRDAVELARQTLKGKIVKFNGESLERERRD